MPEHLSCGGKGFKFIREMPMIAGQDRKAHAHYRGHESRVEEGVFDVTPCDVLIPEVFADMRKNGYKGLAWEKIENKKVVGVVVPNFNNTKRISAPTRPILCYAQILAATVWIPKGQWHYIKCIEDGLFMCEFVHYNKDGDIVDGYQGRAIDYM